MRDFYALPSFVFRRGTDSALVRWACLDVLTVFLSRLAPTCSETQLTSLGAPFGMVKSARFVPKDGEGKSYGFIMFGSRTSPLPLFSLC